MYTIIRSLLAFLIISLLIQFGCKDGVVDPPPLSPEADTAKNYSSTHILA